MNIGSSFSSYRRLNWRQFLPAARTQCVSAVFAVERWLAGWLNVGIVSKRLNLS